MSEEDYSDYQLMNWKFEDVLTLEEVNISLSNHYLCKYCKEYEVELITEAGHYYACPNCDSTYCCEEYDA